MAEGFPYGERTERFLCGSCIDTTTDDRPRRVEPLPGWSKYLDAEAKQRALDAVQALKEAQMSLGEDWGRRWS